MTNSPSITLYHQLHSLNPSTTWASLISPQPPGHFTLISRRMSSLIHDLHTSAPSWKPLLLQAPPFHLNNTLLSPAASKTVHTPTRYAISGCWISILSHG